MKVEVKISADIKEPYAVIYTNSISDEITSMVSAFSSQENVITVYENKRMYFASK